MGSPCTTATASRPPTTMTITPDHTADPGVPGSTRGIGRSVRRRTRRCPHGEQGPHSKAAGSCRPQRWWPALFDPVMRTFRPHSRCAGGVRAGGPHAQSVAATALRAHGSRSPSIVTSRPTSPSKSVGARPLGRHGGRLARRTCSWSSRGRSGGARDRGACPHGAPRHLVHAGRGCGQHQPHNVVGRRGGTCRSGPIRRLRRGMLGGAASGAAQSTGAGGAGGRAPAPQR